MKNTNARGGHSAKLSLLGFDLLEALLAEDDPHIQTAQFRVDDDAEPQSPGLPTPEDLLAEFGGSIEPVPAVEPQPCAADTACDVIETSPQGPTPEAGLQPDVDAGITEVAAIGPVQAVASAERERAPWPRLRASDIARFHTGDVARFEANMTALELVGAIERESRQPSDAERVTLAAFAGWGGLKDVFETTYRPGWPERKARLQELLGEGAFDSARQTVLNAHYTDLDIVAAIWEALGQFGFAGGRVLEPSAGVGHFLGAMPEDVARRSQMHAVEIDRVSGRILQALYGHEARVHIAGLEKCRFPDGWFDLVVGNVPFGKYTVPCSLHKPYSAESIHNYFLGRSLDLVRPGGLVAIITSTYFLDSEREAFRRYIAARARLLGAIRLPRGAFRQCAGTVVSTDILFFQRREFNAVVPQGENGWVQRGALPANLLPPYVDRHLTIKSNWWSEHGELVVGQWKDVRGQYTRELAVEYDGDDVPEQVRARLKHLPSQVYTSCATLQADDTAIEVGDALQAQAWRTGELDVRQDALVVWRAGAWQLAELKGKAEQRARGMVAIRKVARELLEHQLRADATDDELALLRQALNQRYDAFVAAHGCISAKANARVFRRDPDFPLLLSLEIYDPKTDTAEKAPIFAVRTGRPSAAPIRAPSDADAVAISVAETGGVNPRYLAQLLGRDEAEVMRELREASLVFVDPLDNSYVASSQYLCGNVRAKLETARAAGEAFAVNVAALEAALPADLLPHEIETRLGVPWVPCADYEAFILSLAGNSHASWMNAKVTRDANTAAWSVTSNMDDVAQMRTQWGTNRKNAVELIQLSMAGRMATVKDCIDVDGRDVYVVNVQDTAAAREKQAQIEQRFREWLWDDPARTARLTRHYNDHYNTFVDRKFDGSHLRLPGYSWALAPDAHQLNAVARIASGTNTLLAHCVGAGKSLTMAIGSMELRRLGLANKPLHAVPNHLLRQYTAEFVRAYPTAKVLMASREELGDAAGRQLFCARAATGDWDAIIMTHSAFEKITPDPERAKVLIDGMIDEIKSALEARKNDRAERSAVKELVRAQKDWAGRLERARAAWKRDDFITLRQMGVDQIFIDELHLFKNLFRFSQMERVAGLPNANAQRAFDLFIKSREIMALHGNRERGFVGATGTPVANTMAEMHVMQRYLQPRTLDSAGVAQFDAWAAMFGRVVSGLEVSPDGSSFRMNSRFAQFVNVPELMGMFAQVADIQTKEMLQLPTPGLVGGKAQIMAVKPSPALKVYIEGLVKRAEAIRNRSVKPSEDNMLAVTNDGRKAALDVRLVLPHEGFDEEGKVAACVGNVYRLWLKTADSRGTQLIFSDLGTPGSARQFSIYDDIRRRLVVKGIPAEQIAFIHDAKTEAAKEELFALMRDGRIRVLLGSTGKCGIGTNVQTRLYALHHLDAPWRPADVEQRDGRAERRGNMWDAIEIWRYVTEASFDSYLWQTLEVKARFIAQVMSGDRSIRKIEDVGMTALSYEEVKAIACGNPAVKEKAMLDAELRKLQLLRNHHSETVRRARWTLKQAPEQRSFTEKRLAAAKADFAAAQAAGALNLVIDGVQYGDAEIIEAKLQELAQHERGRSHAGDIAHEVAAYAGLAVRVAPSYRKDWGDFSMTLGNELRQEVRPYAHGRRLHQELAGAVANLAAYIGDQQRHLAQLDAEKPTLQAQVDAAFEHDARMAEIRERLTALEVELGLHKAEEGTAAMDEKSKLANATSLDAEAAAAMAEPAEDERADEAEEDATA